jgi:hypothetical protein
MVAHWPDPLGVQEVWPGSQPDYLEGKYFVWNILNILQNIFIWNNGMTYNLDSELRRESMLVT